MVAAVKPGFREVSLRPLRMSDRSQIQVWLADIDLLRFTVLVPGPQYSPVRPYNADAAYRYVVDLVHGAHRASFAVMADGVHVGNIGLKAIESGKGQAECFIELGDPAVRGMGVGHRAMEALLQYGFDDLGLRKITLGVFEFNTAAILLYRRLGFRTGPRYGWHYVDGKFFEVIGMEINQDAYRNYLQAQSAI